MHTKFRRARVRNTLFALVALFAITGRRVW